HSTTRRKVARCALTHRSTGRADPWLLFGVRQHGAPVTLDVSPHNAVRPKGTADVITIFGEGRGFRVVWLLEEMGLPYKLRRVDLQAGVENDAEYLAINPAGFIPAIQDGDVTMVESIA